MLDVVLFRSGFYEMRSDSLEVGNVVRRVESHHFLVSGSVGFLGSQAALT